jgi:hypothetical protein
MPAFYEKSPALNARGFWVLWLSAAQRGALSLRSFGASA